MEIQCTPRSDIQCRPRSDSSLWWNLIQAYTDWSSTEWLQSTLDISKLLGLFFTSSNYLKCKLNLDCKKVSYAKLWLEKAIKCILFQIDASSFAEFEISKFEISRVDCTVILLYPAKYLVEHKDTIKLFSPTIKLFSPYFYGD